MATATAQSKRKSNHGGPRVGSGRPPKIPASYLRNVNLARQLLRDHTLQAAQVFIDCLQDESPKVRLEAAKEICSRAGLALSESDVVVVELPPGKRGILAVCAALIASEININYLYTAWAADDHKPCLAIQVDDLPQAAKVLAHKKFRVLDQDQL